MPEINYTPTSGKAELHITYRCNLQCVNCNRASMLRDEHSLDMTLEDVAEFFRQAEALNWKPDILLIGGEPTLHPQFEDILRMSRQFVKDGLVQVWTNGRDRDLVEYIRAVYHASVPEETFKAKSRTDFPWDDYYVSPADYGMVREKCWQHGSGICGISVDSQGYMPCAVGGMLDGMLKMGLRTKVLADLFDNEKNAEITKRMCQHCGACLSQLLLGEELVNWRKYVEMQPKKFGARMSPKWMEATIGMK